MTLYRQLLIFILVILLLLFTGMWGSKLNTTRDYLINQMESHAQDTATSLGLSLTTFISDKDIPGIETMINAVFDRGYYRSIILFDMEGKKIVSSTQEVKVKAVPQWFIRIVPLQPPKAESLVMKGWQRAGKIVVESHPGFAYDTLWRTSVSTAIWFTVSAIGAALLGSIGLALLLRPLRRVEAQALKLCNREYQTQERIPRTRELKQVVSAMNQMTSKVQQMFFEQASIADNLLQQTFQDTVTGLGNRRYMEGQVISKISEKKFQVQGVFLLLQCTQLHEVNTKQGYGAGDRLLKTVAEILTRECEKKGASLARLGGGDFAILLPNIEEEDAKELLHRILLESKHALDGLLQPDECEGEGGVVGGGVCYTCPLDFNKLLSGADEALRSAIYGGEIRGLIVEEESKERTFPKERAEWKPFLEHIIKQDAIELFYQKTVSPQDITNPVHLEIFTRIPMADTSFVPAGLFIPLAEKYDFIQDLDRGVITTILEQQEQVTVTQRLAINLSLVALSEESFYVWLLEKLHSLPVDGLKFNFEFSENRLLQHMDLVGRFREDIKEMGHYIGIDHFGQGLNHFGYLQTLMPNYVKIDRAITRNLTAEGDDIVFFIRSLCTVAHSLDIRVIGEGIETKEQLALLESIPLDALQGYYIHHPEPLFT